MRIVRSKDSKIQKFKRFKKFKCPAGVQRSSMPCGCSIGFKCASRVQKVQSSVGVPGVQMPCGLSEIQKFQYSKIKEFKDSKFKDQNSKISFAQLPSVGRGIQGFVCLNAQVIRQVHRTSFF